MVSLFRRDGLDMTKGPFMKNLILFAVPVFLTGLLQLLYNAADLVVVGKFSSEATLAQGAIQSTTSLIHMLVNASMGLAVGINVAAAKYIGAKNENAVSRVVHTAMVLAVIAGVIVSTVGIIFCKRFLSLMNSPSDVIDLSALYLRIYFIGTPFNLIYNFGAAALRAKGQTQKPLMFLFMSGLINVGLNLFFVLVMDLSVEGVGIGTVVSQAVSAVLVVAELKRTKGYCRLEFKKLGVSRDALAEILKIGVPAGIQTSLFSISNVIIQSTVNSFGSVTVAANGNAQNLEGILNIAVDSVYQASLSFIGQNYGAAKKDNIGVVMRSTFIMMTVVCIAISGVMVPLRATFLGIYSNDAEVIAIGSRRIAINAALYVLFGWMQLNVAYLRGLGYGTMPTAVSVIGICVLRILWIELVFPLWPALECIYYSYPISWAITSLTLLICFIAVRKKAFDKMEKEHGENASLAPDGAQ